MLWFFQASRRFFFELLERLQNERLAVEFAKPRWFEPETKAGLRGLRTSLTPHSVLSSEGISVIHSCSVLAVRYVPKKKTFKGQDGSDLRPKGCAQSAQVGSLPSCFRILVLTFECGEQTTSSCLLEAYVISMGESKGERRGESQIQIFRCGSVWNTGSICGCLVAVFEYAHGRRRGQQRNEFDVSEDGLQGIEACKCDVTNDNRHALTAYVEKSARMGSCLSDEEASLPNDESHER